MVARFVARGGVLGTVVLVVLAVAVIGFAGAVVEHYRLASQQEQQDCDDQDSSFNQVPRNCVNRPVHEVGAVVELFNAHAFG